MAGPHPAGVEATRRSDGTQRLRVALLAIALVYAAAVLPFLGRTSLWRSDEARLAMISRGMWESGDFVVPRLGAEVYSRYPPLAFWLLAPTGGALGFDEFSLRLPGALAGLALLMALARLGSRWAGAEAGVAAALVLAITPGFLAEVAICRANVLLALCATVAVERFVAVMRGDSRAVAVAGFWIALALGVLARGPAGVLVPGLGAAAWVWFARDAPLARLRPAWGIPLFAAIALPWYLLVLHREGLGFLEMNLLRENLEAFASGFEHPRPAWFYLARLPLAWLPGVLLAPLVWRARRGPGVASAAAWALLLLLVLSISSNKRVSYLVWFYPAGALALGAAFPALALRVRQRVAAAAPVALLAAGLLAAVYGAWIRPRDDADGRAGIAFARVIERHVPPGMRVGTLAAFGDPAYFFYLRRELETRSGEPGIYLAYAEQRARLAAAGLPLAVLASHRDSHGRELLLLRLGSPDAALSSAREPLRAPPRLQPPRSASRRRSGRRSTARSRRG